MNKNRIQEVITV